MIKSAEFFDINPSKTMKTLIVSLHGMALMASCLNGLEIIAQVILALLVLISLFLQLWVYNAETHIRLRYSEYSGWALVLTGDQYQSFVLNESSILTTWVAVLYCTLDQKQRVVVVFHDSLPYRNYRRLLVILRVSGP